MSKSTPKQIFNRLQPYQILFILLLVTCLYAQQTPQQKRQRIQNEQTTNRQNIHLIYGQNTQTLTFAMSMMSDFIIKPDADQQVKIVTHVYWKQNNVYVGSQYRQSQNMRVLVYQDTYMILQDIKFYITTGIKFQAKKSKIYTIRFIDQGRINKLIALELTKQQKLQTQKFANKQQLSKSTNKLKQLSKQIKIMSTVSEFSIVMIQRNIKNMLDSFNVYFWYIVVQAIFVFGIVGLQVKILLNMLKNQSVV